jgi:predicted  nucleic acid-binding Zn-ribbon protein
VQDLRKNVNDLKLELSTIANEMSQLQLDISAEEKGVKDDEVVVDKWDLDVLTKQVKCS